MNELKQIAEARSQRLEELRKIPLRSPALDALFDLMIRESDAVNRSEGKPWNPFNHYEVLKSESRRKADMELGK